MAPEPHRSLPNATLLPHLARIPFTTGPPPGSDCLHNEGPRLTQKPPNTHFRLHSRGPLINLSKPVDYYFFVVRAASLSECCGQGATPVAAHNRHKARRVMPRSLGHQGWWNGGPGLFFPYTGSNEKLPYIYIYIIPLYFLCIYSSTPSPKSPKFLLTAN